MYSEGHKHVADVKLDSVVFLQGTVVTGTVNNYWKN